MNTPALKFALRFALGFAVLMGLFEASRGTSFESFIVEKLILGPTTTLINTLAPEEHVSLVGRTIVSPDGANLRVTRGCEGVELFLLLVAAILAFPTSAKRMAQGLLLGSILAYILSVTRLMALHHVLRHEPNLWESLHGIVLPLGPVLVLSLYFLHWSSTDPHLGKGLALHPIAPRPSALDSRHV
jgi:exosortase family protein XrtM